MKPKYPVRRGGIPGTAAKAVFVLVAGFAGLVLLCAAGLGILLAVYKPSDYENLLADAVEKATGLHPAFYGDVETTLFPALGLKTGKLTLSNPDASADPELLSVESASVFLSASSLLRGVPEIEEILLSGLNVTLTVDPTGRNNWSPAKKQPAGASSAEPAVVPLAPPDDARKNDRLKPAWSLKRVDCRDISLTYRDLRGGEAYGADIDTLVLTGLKDGSAAPLTLSGRVRDEAGGNTLSFLLKAALEIRAGDTEAGPSLHLDIAKLELGAQGKTLNPVAAELGGKIEFFASGAWKAEAVEGSLILPGAAPSHFRGGAILTRDRGDKKHLEGNLALDRLDIGALPRLQTRAAGTPAEGRVQGAPNLTRPVVAGAQSSPAGADTGRDKAGQGERRGSRAPEKSAASSPVPPGLLNLETAFTLTVDKAVYGTITLDDIRGDLKMRDGKADLVYSLTLFRGRLKGRASLDPRGAEPDLALNATLHDLDTASASGAFSDHFILTGKAGASLDLKCKGRTSDAALHSLNGKASFAVAGGEASGFSPAPEFSGFIPLPASFAYRSISASAVITQGEAVTKDISLISEALLARGGGTIRLAYGQADLGIDFMTAGPPVGPAVPVSIRGPLNALSYSIDTRTLLRNAVENAARSPEAASDLLKKPKDAIRGLKERLAPRR
jgi:AsmA protein